MRADSDAAGKSSARTLDGLDPKNLVDQVKARNLDALSDGELFRQAAAIVSRPPADELQASCCMPRWSSWPATGSFAW